MSALRGLQRITPSQAKRFEQVCWPHMQMVLRTAQYLTSDATRADDLAQETMLKALRAIDSFRDGTDAKAWLLTILRRTHIDQLRSGEMRRHERSLEEPMLPAAAELTQEFTGEPEGLLELFADAELIDALKRLPDPIRWTLLLVDVEGLDHQQAAEILRVPTGTIKSRAHRGRLMMRQQLEGSVHATRRVVMPAAEAAFANRATSICAA